MDNILISRLENKQSYNFIQNKLAEKIWKYFTNHDYCINEKYKSFRTNESISSDRERFVSKLFGQFINKNIILIDKEVICEYVNDTLILCEHPYSLFSCNRKYWIKTVTQSIKKFLHINSIEAINELNGSGYIRITCTDIFNHSLIIKLAPDTMCDLYFRFITNNQFSQIENLFKDNRSDIPFKVTSISEDAKVNEQIVMAKDSEDASSKVSEYIKIERVEKE